MGTLYEEKLRQHIGSESERMVAVDAVGAPMIRHWVEVMHDRNPAFTDPEWAAESRFGSIVAPGAMMQVWSMAPLWPERDLAPLPIAPIDDALEELGFTDVVATAQSMRVANPAKVGDVVSYVVRVANVTEDEKRTRLGPAYFVTFEYVFSNQDGVDLGTLSFTYMRYKPEPEGSGESAA
jgi:acyl dehydratase